MGGENIYNSVDAPLWFFWALQQYVIHTGDWKVIWEKYKNVMSRILKEFSNSKMFDISMQENGLLKAGNENEALTCMNVVIDGKPLLNRSGLAVEVNAFGITLFGSTLK
ncbi:MAG: amylo-alpha-1,6-glucosidase [Bacteroidales bacterium]